MTQTAMVTGASSGIGEAYSARLAALGYDLLIVARRDDRLRDLAARLRTEHGVTVRCVQADLSGAGEVARLCDEITRVDLDLLVNNAGVAHYRGFVDLTAEAAQELVAVNVLAPVLLTHAALPGMVARGRGSIVNVASLLAFSGPVDAPQLPKRVVYAATKSFLVTFSEVLAREVAGHGVYVQVVCPGVVRSEFHTRQGIDMTTVPRMEPNQVVEASLADLDAGVVVSIPGLADTHTIERRDAANRDLVAAARATDLPSRYQQSSRPDNA